MARPFNLIRAHFHSSPLKVLDFLTLICNNFIVHTLPDAWAIVVPSCSEAMPSPTLFL
jgi:hypothetical protein